MKKSTSVDPIVNKKVIYIEQGSSLVNWMKCIFPEDPYWIVIPEDIMRQDRANVERDDLIQIGNLKYSRIQWLGYTFGILVSGCYYELRFKEYYKNKTSVRLIFSPNLRTFIEWIQSEWLKINYTIDSDRHSWDFKTLANKLMFIDPEWWTKKQRTEEVIYLRFSPYGDKKDIAKIRFEYAKKAILKFFEHMFNGIDKKDFLYFFQKGVDCLPIDILDDKIISIKWSNVMSRGRVANFCKKHCPEIDVSKYEGSVLTDVIDRCRTYFYHDVKNSGYFKYTLLDSVRWSPLNRAAHSYMALSIKQKGEANKRAFSKSDKRYIFEKYGFKVFNSNHCFSKKKYIASEVYVINNFCQGLYKDEKWKDVYGGVDEVFDLIDSLDPKFIKKKFKYKKEHTVEMNHFPMKDTYSSLKTTGYAMYDRDLANPMFTRDHIKLNACKNEADQLRVFLKEKWLTKEECIEFCISKMKRVREIEKERNLGKELFNLLKLRFEEVLGEIVYV